MSLAPASRARLGLLWLSIASRGGGPPVRPAPRRCVARSWGGPVTRRLRAGPAPAVFHFHNTYISKENHGGKPTSKVPKAPGPHSDM